MSARFRDVPVPALPGELRGLLPEQGSFELQRDRPGKMHNWHRHSVDEELFVLDGDVTLFWLDDDDRLASRPCAPGTWIELPALTRHGSVAGPGGAVYVIRPRDGATAETTWLDPAEHPDPPRPSADAVR